MTGPSPVRQDFFPRISIHSISLSAGVRNRLGTVVIAGVAALGRGLIAIQGAGSIQLGIGNCISTQLSGADVPCAFLLIVLSAVDVLHTQSCADSGRTGTACGQVSNGLYAIVSYFVQIGILVCYDVQVTSAVGGRLGGEGQEVDVGLREQSAISLLKSKVNSRFRAD